MYAIRSYYVHSSDDPAGSVTDGHDDNHQKSPLAEAGLGQTTGATDDHQTGAGTDEVTDPQVVELARTEDLRRSFVLYSYNFV